ncbi:hypothetical protein Tsubulata_015537 [Turnera subulata]|uniref:glycerophosphodiester phosphodiesterase n=1 Tax=Turnera subulata TaxID=218843 RepID=A0A9Q0G2K1_9ROSI|nr:hypothetical protein Tsubulata_015537 [Turnera subulata]
MLTAPRRLNSPAMYNRRASATPLSAAGAAAAAAPLLLLLLLQCSLLPSVSAQRSVWQTLSGNPPLVIARGGFSGLFPYGSANAFQFTGLVSVPDVIVWCDVQLTKDGVGICLPDLLMQNSTSVAQAFPGRDNSYPVNGVSTKGYFTVDFTFNELANVLLLQGIYSRSDRFDNAFLIQTVEELAAVKPPGIWLNIQHNDFFTQHNLSMRNYVLSISRTVVVKYISSPEVGFLRSIAARFNPNITKLVFRFLGPDEIEPFTNQTYGSLLSNLTFIKTFASGVLVPKTYIWPQSADLYLQPHTSIVSDAHKAGLEVFASDFASDFQLSYNYSYDPIAEYLNFIDNGDFSVDGMLSDFPITPSAARVLLTTVKLFYLRNSEMHFLVSELFIFGNIVVKTLNISFNVAECFSHLGRNASKQVNFTIITKEGASGDYPGCTDLAYQNAISFGADVIDCPVQMSKDGVPFCSGSINLMDNTDVAQSSSSSPENIPGLGSGIFSFSLAWDEIQKLTPAISNPYTKFELLRNPRFKSAGKLQTLADFLALAKNATSLSGVLISIENAPYLIEKQSLPVIDAVLDVLSKAGYDNQTAKKVMIQSTNSSVLTKFNGKSNYELVYEVDETIGDALDDTVKDIKTFADSVVVGKTSVFGVSSQFLISTTNVVSRLQSFGLSVYAQTFNNEFVSQPWDFFSDATVEVNSYVLAGNVSGVITDFPQTSARYRMSRCLSSENLPPYMTPAQPGALVQVVPPFAFPPAAAPLPVLKESDVVESPIPPISAKPPAAGGGTAAPPTPPNGQPKISACISLASLPVLLSILFLF